MPYFGYDNLVGHAIAVEVATLEALGELKIIPEEEAKLLTPDVKSRLCDITTTQVDFVERKVTKHDVRALVRLMQEVLPEPLRRWVHVPLTSYDVLDTARALMFKQAHEQVVLPHALSLADEFAEFVEKYAEVVQIGRTHGQHAVPITVGFWAAGILSRFVSAIEFLADAATCLVGKISGPVGAYNAQVALGVCSQDPRSFLEELVLKKLGLHAEYISTQIVVPEPLANYLFATLQTSSVLGQFGRDGRHLMRSEIGELREQFVSGQVGSSTMAHKRNPITFENLEGTWLRSRSEFGKVLDTLLTDHQRDLVGSSLFRDLPVLVVNLVHQMEALLRKDKNETTFVGRLSVDEEACARNVRASGARVLAEPAYILLQSRGYSGDAHEVLNRVSGAMRDDESMWEALLREVKESADSELCDAVGDLKEEEISILSSVEHYTGCAAEMALHVAHEMRQRVDDLKESSSH